MSEVTKHATDIRRIDDVRIPVDSEEVAAARYTPVDVDEPLPALLMYVPYHKDDFITYARYDPLNRYLARQGFEVVVADMLGTGASTGHVEEMFLRREGEEGAAIVEWLADREWTNGRVGIYGKSYGGITALDTAAQRPDALEAIAPIHTPYLGYRNGYTYDGMPELFTIFMHWLTMVQALSVTPPSRRDADGRWEEAWQQRLDSVGERTPWAVQFFRHPFKDDYWGDKDIPVEDVAVPTLAVGGWRDSYTRDTLEYFDAIDAPKQLVFGPWRHEMPHRGREVSVDIRQRLADWFDHYLKDGDGGVGVPDGKEIVYWTERGGGGRVDAGEWHARSEWPSVGEAAGTTPETMRSLALTHSGLVAPDGFDSGAIEREYEIDHTVGLAATNPVGASLEPQPTNADDARSLTFDSGPLDEPFELTGTGQAEVRVQPTVADFPLSVRVADVSPNGDARLVTQGTMRATCRYGPETPADVEPGEEYTFTVPLQPKSHLFEAGHRIRVAVAGAYFPEYMPVGDHGSFTVRSSPADPTLVRLPGRTRDEITSDPVDVGAPATDEEVVADRVRDRSVSWETSRNRTDGVASAEMNSTLQVDLPHADYAERGTFAAEIAADDTDAFESQNRYHITITRADEEIDVVATNRFTREDIELTTRIDVDGETYFEQHWQE